MSRLLLLFLVLHTLFGFGSLSGQSREIAIQNLSQEDGLASRTVYSICQDSRGFMWFGTENGLSRYDGYTFKNYFHDPGDSTSLSNNFIWSIIEDHTGALWIGTVGGLNRFDRNTEAFTHYLHDPEDSTSLSYSYVRAVYEDHENVIWVGTTNGVSRFDRETATFRSYNRDESGEDLDDTYTLAINEDTNHTLWVGTGDGLYRYDHSSDKLIRNTSWDAITSSYKSVMAIHQDTSSAYWLGGFGHGVVVRLSPSGDFEPLPATNFLAGAGSVRALCADRSGKIWCASHYGLFCYDPGNGETIHYSRLPESSDQIGYLFAVAIDAAGIIWAGSQNNGIIKLTPKKKAITHYIPPHPPANTPHAKVITSLATDNFGQTLIGSRHNGIYQLNPKSNSLEHFASPPGEVNAHYFDRSNTLWIGGNRTFACQRMMQADSFKTRITFSVNLNGAKDSQGAPFHSIENVGLVGQPFPLQWPGNGWPDTEKDKVIFLNDSGHEGDALANDGIWSKDITFSAPAAAWIQYKYSVNWGLQTNNGTNDNEAGFRDDHFIQLSPTLKKGAVRDDFGQMGAGQVIAMEKFAAPVSRALTFSIPFPDPNQAIYVNSFCEDRFGDFWIATDGVGVLRFDREKGEIVKRYERDPADSTSLSSNKCKVVFEDASGTLWVGTWSNGLNKYDRSTDSFLRYQHDPNNTNSLNDNRLMTICEAPKGTLWIGTSSGGLNRFDLRTETFKHFTMNDGLPSNNIYGVIPDDSGHLWISTDRGLARMGIKSGIIRSYDKLDGLPGTEFNERAFHQSQDGRLFFGAQDKLIVFHPDSLRDNSYVPPVVFTGFELFSRPVRLDSAISEKKHIILPHDQNFVAFEYAALNYQVSEKNRYRYRLEGADETWVEAGTRRLASYTNLAPGDYLFRVIGSNNDGLWNETGTSIRLTILPPWWRTNVAYACYALLFFGLLYGWRRFELQRARIKNELAMQRFEADKLREIDSMKSRFFANISHEFRTPLTLILGPLDTLLRRQPDAETVQNLTMMQRNARRLQQLINQLLDLSKLDARRMELRTRPDNMTRLLRGIVYSFASHAQCQKITLEWHAPEQDIFGQIDAEKVEKIFTNLLSNAFKFTPQGGKICVQLTVNSSQLTKDQMITNHRSLITVEDTGIGISPEVLPHIFDRFYQVNNSATRAFEGTGIGLALTKELVELHGGTIGVTSTPKRGTIFVVSLPLIPAEEQELASSEPSENMVAESGGSQPVFAVASGKVSRHGPSLLIVDDHEDVRTYIRSGLQQSYRIIEAANGEDGWQVAQKRLPDLIISDVMMPLLDGFAFCARLKTNAKTSHIPVILLTAKAGEENKIEGLETGADDYLTKPFDTKELRVRVRNLIDQRQQLRERFRKEMSVQPEQVTATSLDAQFLQKAMAVIEEQLAKKDDRKRDLSVEFLAKNMAMSRQHLNRKMRGVLGITANAFITSVQVKRAAQLLEQRAYTASQVAYAVGFNNASYFATCFRKRFGCSPSEFLARGSKSGM